MRVFAAGFTLPLPIKVQWSGGFGALLPLEHRTAIAQGGPFEVTVEGTHE